MNSHDGYRAHVDELRKTNHSQYCNSICYEAGFNDGLREGIHLGPASTYPRSEGSTKYVTKWDLRWMDLARLAATWSKDRSRKVGAVIVLDNRVLSIGWNGFPRRINDDVDERHQRPAKYKWTEHAERNAIYNAAAHGIQLTGSTMYLPWYPCADCARAIVQSGICEIVAIEPNWNDPTFAADFAITKTIFEEADLLVTFMDGEAPVAA